VVDDGSAVYGIVVRHSDDDRIGTVVFGVDGVRDGVSRTGRAHSRDDGNVATHFVDDRTDDVRSLTGFEHRELAVGTQWKNAVNTSIDDESGVGGRRIVIDRFVVVERGNNRREYTVDETLSTALLSYCHRMKSFGYRCN